MKLRIKGNSIRLRLSKPEVAQLAVEGAVEEITTIGDSCFVYRLVKHDQSLNASFSNNELVVSLPHGFANEWPGNDVIGIDNKNADGSLPVLYILVEKDFKCIDNTEEDQRDNYENPKAC